MTDYAKQYEELNKRIAEANTRIIQLKAAENSEKENFKNYVKEIQALGVEPTNLAATLLNMEKEMAEEIEETKKKLLETEASIKSIDDSISTLKGDV